MIVDPEGWSYEMDRSRTVSNAIGNSAAAKDTDESIDPEIVAGCLRDNNESLQRNDSVPLSHSWWDFDAIEGLVRRYVSGHTGGNYNTKRNELERVNSSSDDSTLQIIAEEARRLEQEINQRGSASDNLAQLELFDDRHQKLSRSQSQALERRASATETTTAYLSSSVSTQSSSPSSSYDPSSGISKQEKNTHQPQGWKTAWKNAVQRIGHRVVVILTAIAKCAARNPFLCITSTTVFSMIMLTAGWYTNFNLVVENAELWPPKKSFSVHQAHWLYEQTNFNYEYRYIDMIVHAQGDNVLSQQGISRVFEALDVVRSMPDYQEGCSWAKLVGDSYQVGECKIYSVADFWNESQAIFESQISSDDDTIHALAAANYPNGHRVDLYRVIGNPEWDGNGNLASAQAFLIEFDLPWSYETEEFELVALDALFQLQDQWRSETDNPFQIEVNAYRSYEDEFLRSIILDLPLLPGVFAVMAIFCCLAFWRRHKVRSRSLLGLGAVVCIVLSIMTSFGFLFLLGIPFTTSTTMLPFLMFGIGLDDAFIIIGSYNRTHGDDIVKRIDTTMHDIGLSIFITTATSALAFGLGCFSNIPAVQWLCLYAFPSIIIDFLYQITFFIALVVLDERRIQAGYLDCCACVEAKDDKKVKASKEEGASTTDDESFEKMGGKEITLRSATTHQEMHWTDRFMRWYAEKLLRPTTQKCVLLFFILLLSGSTYSASQLRQYFDLNDLVPQDSYLTGYHKALKSFGTTHSGLPSFAYFRSIDQSDPKIQKDMIKYMKELYRSDAIAAPPINFWVQDFVNFANHSNIQPLSFDKQIEAFLNDPVYHSLYHDHIVRDKTGEVTNTRCEIYIDIDLSDSRGGIAALKKLRDVTRSQPINQGLNGEEWKMFTYQDQYHLWEFYSAVISELTFTTIMGVAAVSVIATLLIPHWTAVFFISPLILCLYVDMLGYINYAGVHVNAISYVQLVMSIGLMVDFIMHILMRYYEVSGTRLERVKNTLETMGSSIFVGGLSSFLGVLLLVFSTSQILQSVFVSVMGLVLLGILHGLVFLPVILSLIGPE